MSTLQEIKAKVQQAGTPTPVAEGAIDHVKMSKLGALFTVGWKQQMLLAGRLFQARVGTLTAGASMALVVGGGNGTVIDADQPELIIGVDAGYYLIPVDVRCSVQSDSDADADLQEIVLFADRTQAPLSATAMASAVIHTPLNMLDIDSAPAFPGRCWVQATADIDDPITSIILDYVTFRQIQDASATGSSPMLRMEYKPESPHIIKGPCQVLLCWGGVVAVNGFGIVEVAVVPDSWIEA